MLFLAGALAAGFLAATSFLFGKGFVLYISTWIPGSAYIYKEWKYTVPGKDGRKKIKKIKSTKHKSN